jgi:hypothetical protein
LRRAVQTLTEPAGERDSIGEFPLVGDSGRALGPVCAARSDPVENLPTALGERD